MKILVLGSSGQLGKSFEERLKYTNHETYFLTKSDLPIQNFKKVKDFLELYTYQVVINTAAYTKVDESEQNIDDTFLINHLAVKNLSRICFEQDILLIHFSTDYVFNGKSKKPYKENDTTSASGCYGLSKLQGEKSIIDSECKHIIFRTSWLYSEYGENFLKTMMNLIQMKDLGRNLYVVNDQIGRPTCASDLASAVIHVLENISIDRNIKEIFHFSGDKTCSWYDFAQEIYSIAKNLKIDVKNKPQPISTVEYNRLIKSEDSFRPAYSVLDNGKFQKNFLYNQENFDESITRCLNILHKLP